MSYVTLNDLKGYLGISTTQTSDDALLAEFITRAEGLINGRTGRVFEGVSETRYFTADDIFGDELVLYSNDLLAVTKLTNGDAVEIASANYRLFPRNQAQKWIIKLKSGYSWEFSTDDSEISVQGVWGWSVTAPEDIQQATLRLAAFLYRQKDNSSDVDRPLVTGDGVTIMPSALPSDVDKILKRYEVRV